MYHWVPSSISRTAAHESPPGRPTRASSSTGKTAVAGMEAITCTTGCRRRDHFGERPMATPAGTVQATPISKAARVRSQVAKAASSNVPQVPRLTCTSNCTMDHRPKRASTPNKNTKTQLATLRTGGKRDACGGKGSGEVAPGNGCKPSKRLANNRPKGPKTFRLASTIIAEPRRGSNKREVG